MVYESFSESDTYNIARQIGQSAALGDVYALTGDLAAGKTVFARGFAKGLGIDDVVNSPTFTIVQEYDGTRLKLYHFDVYRIGDISEMTDVGFDDYIYGDGVCLIEWAKLIEDILPHDVRHITIDKDYDRGDNYRKITIS